MNDMPAKKETTDKPKKTAAGGSKTRYSYADVVKSNQEVRDAIKALADAIAAGGAPAPETAPAPEQPAPPQAPEVPEIPKGDSEYLTSREQFDIYNKIISRRDAEFADRNFMALMEQVCALREDFRRLCTGLEQNAASMKPEDVFSSFKNYQVDIDNMLKDAGVRYGAFNTQDQKADPVFQRVVGVVPTDDASLDGTVAKRLSAGYEYKGRPVYKEKIMVYRKKSQ